MKNIYLCGNLGPNIGMGHFYRLLAFAQLCGKNFNFHMAVPQVELVKDHLPSWLHPIQADNITQLLETIDKPGEAMVVVDSYEASNEWFEALREAGIKSIYIDDLFVDLGSDVIINHGAGVVNSQYERENAFCGSRFALLRPRFFESGTATPRNGNLLLCIGGADPMDLSFAICDLLKKVGYNQGIDVVLGPAYQGNLLHSRLPGVTIKSNLSENQMADLMDNALAAIAPASTTSMELCSRRTPLLCGYFVDNQRQIHKGLVQANAIIDLNRLDELSTSSLKDALDKLTKDEVVSNMIQAQEKLIDHQSGRRIQAIVSNLFGPKLTYRSAQSADWKPLLDWRNDPITRANSFDTGEIDVEGHKRWFANSLDNPKRAIYIFEYQGQDAGMVRADETEGIITLSWNVAPSMRGLGLGKRMVAEVCDLQKFPTRAEIKHENIASRKIAEFCGMRQIESGEDMLIFEKS